MVLSYVFQVDTLVPIGLPSRRPKDTWQAQEMGLEANIPVMFGGQLADLVILGNSGSSLDL